jgi:hypothetical protein
MVWGTLVDIKDQLRFGSETPCRERFKVAALKLFQPVPLRLGIGSQRFLDRGKSLKRLLGPTAMEFGCAGFKGKPSFKVISRLDAFASMRAL